MKELRSVSVPDEMAGPFLEAERRVESWFSTFAQSPEKGTITIGGERYILVRAASMSVHFVDYIRSMYPGLDDENSLSVVNRLLFDLAFSIGENDAQNFCARTGVTDPIERLSTGPVHFAWAGWAYVTLLPESTPSQDESCMMVYEHPQSFESDAWIASGRTSDECVCHMNAGYSSGWCSTSFNVRLSAREITCRARGDAQCRFVMAPPDRLEARIQALEQQWSEEGGA